jgi:hypothetical protein
MGNLRANPLFGFAGIPMKKSCTVQAVAGTRLLEDGNMETEELFLCIVDAVDALNGQTGMAYSIVGTDKQMKYFKDELTHGRLTSGVSKYMHFEATIVDSKGGYLKLPPGKPISFHNTDQGQGNRNNGRNLATAVLGEHKFLVVKVTDVNGLTHPNSSATMSDKVFGTTSDTVHLKSQIEGCSFNQYRVTAGCPLEDQACISAGLNGNEAPDGVIEVTLPIALEGSRATDVRNAITTAVQNKLGINLPGPFSHVLYSLQSCYKYENATTGLDACGWAAYAYVNSWMQVYQGDCKHKLLVSSCFFVSFAQ